ncbi:MAG: hypothetical protein KIT69_06565 [Propionibacteriaceae bacterium]|nr:hypothetical protein [Propionibacteriaceae bacterium]
MPETDVDRRQWRLLLLGHDVLTTADAVTVVNWADRHGVGLYQLPLPAHALRPKTASGHRSRPRIAELRDELAGLHAVFTDIADYAGAGYQILGVAITAATDRTKAGHAWLQRVQLIAAETAGLELTTWVVPSLPEAGVGGIARPQRQAS